MDVSCFIFYGDSVGEVVKVLNENASPRQSLLNELKAKLFNFSHFNSDDCTGFDTIKKVETTTA
jgi:hypothetical protein